MAERQQEILFDTETIGRAIRENTETRRLKRGAGRVYQYAESLHLPSVGAIGIDLAREGANHTGIIRYSSDGKLKTIGFWPSPPVSGANRGFEEAVGREVERRLRVALRKFQDLRRNTWGKQADNVCLLAGQFQQALEAAIGETASTEGQEALPVLDATPCARCKGPIGGCYATLTEPRHGFPAGSVFCLNCEPLVRMSELPAKPAEGPLSPCCGATTFVSGTSRVCDRCRCTRPL